MVRTRTRERAPNIDLLASNPIAKLFFFNIFGLLRLYRRRNDPQLDFLNLDQSESAKATGLKLDSAWKKVYENKSTTPTLKRVLYEAFGPAYSKLGIWRIFWIIFMYLSAYVFFKLIVGYVAEAPPQNHAFKGFHVSISQLGAHLIAVAILLSCALSSLCSHQMKAECTRIGIQVRASLMVMIYRKSLRLHSVTGEMGDIVTLVGDHCNSIAEAFVNFHFLWSTSVEILVVIALAFVELRLAALPLVGILIVLFPIQFFLAQYAANISKRKTKITSERVHLTSEILTAIKLVKFYAWETYFYKRISKVREREMHQLSLQFITKSFLLAIVFGTPILATIASLQTFGLIYPDEILSGELIFTILSIFNTLRYPLLMLPNAIQTTRAASTSLQVIEDFLTKPEVIPLLLSTQSPPEPDIKLLVSDADFAWKTNSKPTLKGINFTISKGQLCAIVGDVGAGKSSLVCALMGQMFQQSGKTELFGSMSYVPNEPWILNATVRDNIVFGSKFDLDRYRQVVKVCALNRDFRNLVNGDRTEIGERGINLTLGQRHRISLARAAYSNSDIIFMDDPLSVMDARVSKHIFKEVLQEFLKDRAIVFVTNQLQYLPRCHHIMVMKSGKCIEQGSYQELMANDIDLAALVGESVEIEDPNKIDDLALDDDFFLTQFNDGNTNGNLNDSPDTDTDINTNTQNIKIVVNGVPDRPRASFMETDQNSINPTVTFSRTNTIERSSAQNNQAVNDITISRMIERVNHMPSEQAVNTIIDRHQLSVLGGAGLAMNINATQAENNALARALERNQMTIHSIQVQDGFEESAEEPIDRSKLLKSLYLAFFKEGSGIWLTVFCFVFFFVVHVARLYNDYWLKVISDLNATSADLHFYLGVFSYLGTAFIVGIILRGLLFTWIMVKKGISFHKNMLEPILSAPMSYFEYTPLSRILTSFARHLTLVDEHMFDSIFYALQFLPLIIGTFLLSVIVVPFLAIPGIILLSLCLFLIWYVKGVEDKIQHSEVNSRSPMFSHLAATLEGLQSIRVYRIQARFDAFNLIKIDSSNKALYALTLVKCWLALYIDILASVLIYLSVLLVLIQEPSNFSLTEGLVGLALSNAMQILLFGQITVQAIQDSYGSIWSIDQLIHFRTSITPEGQQDSEDYQPPPDWPTNGQINFQNVMLRYHRYGVAVLKNVSFTIQGREKVAIVGSTGSGKTTLLTSLLRLVEAGEGQILIDNVDISSIGLEALRRSIAVIPQDPVLFYGTVRSNLDPYGLCSEQEMWDALKSVHLIEKVQDMPLKLDTPIVENGTIFTFAQRQLFCIARAILLKCKILILDEATSAVDLHTEHMIQETIDSNFQNYTILFVGHRLNSIIEADKILVMDQGQVVEYDSPDVLLSNPDGHFYSMVLQNGEEVVKSLHTQAISKAEVRHKRRSDILERHASIEHHTVSDSHQITVKTLGSHLSPSTHSSIRIRSKDMPRSLEGVFQNLPTSSTHSLTNDGSPTSSSAPLANSKESAQSVPKTPNPNS